MEYSAYLNLDKLSDDARKELENFISFLQFKYRKSVNKNKTGKTRKQFNALNLDTRGFKFDRDEANAR